MNKQLASVIWLEALIAFTVPFAATMLPAVAPWAAAGAPAPNKWAVISMLAAGCIAGGSALKSFLSTTVSDARSELTDAANSATISPSLNQTQTPKTP